MKVNIYLDAYLHHFVSHFRETVTQSAKGGMCFFRERPSLILHNIVWKILGTKKVKIYLNTYLHNLFLPITESVSESVTQSAKGGMCFFRERPSLILHNIVWKILGTKKVKIYLNTYLHNLFLPITESVSESAKKRNLSAYMFGFIIDFSWETSSALG